jgi:hypothetical protein
LTGLLFASSWIVLMLTAHELFSARIALRGEYCAAMEEN